MTVSEGHREIEAAKKRVAAAKEQIVSAAEILESATSMVETAIKNKNTAVLMIGNSRTELAAAEKFLKESEDRWQVIDVDDNAINKKLATENDNNKKRKRSKLDNGFINYNDMSRVLSKVRYYRQYFEGKTFGIQLIVMFRRLVVANKRYGESKPALGDVLVAINGYRLPIDTLLDEACRYMRQLLIQGTVELTFLVDSEFSKFCLLPVTQARQQLLQKGSKNNNNCSELKKSQQEWPRPEPQYINIPQKFTPTWTNPLPPTLGIGKTGSSSSKSSDNDSSPSESPDEDTEPPRGQGVTTRSSLRKRLTY